MGSHADALVAQFTATHNDFSQLVRQLSPQDWDRTPPGEERTAGVIAYHTAQGYLATLSLAQVIAAGEPLPVLTPEWMNAANAQQAAEHAHATRDEVLGLLEANYSTVVAALSALSDEQLAAPRDFFGHPATAEQGVAYLMIHHVADHAASIKEAVVEPVS